MDFKERVLFCDNHILVLNKPAGMLTQPNVGFPPSLECWGKQWLKERFQKKGNVFLQALHRIDKPVSGVLLFARTSKALSRLNEAIREHQFNKEYLAWVEGQLLEDKGELQHFLEKGEHKTHVVDASYPNAKECHLHFETIKRVKGESYLKIILITGRYHQIRAQFAAIGHPILGDQKYGSKKELPHLYLHHAALTFPHPITQERVRLQAPLPPSFCQKTL